MSDTEIVGLFVVAGVALIVAIFAAFRTRNIKPLETFIDGRVEDVQLTSELELQFSRLPLARQEAIMKLIDVADPFTKFWPGDLDDKTVAWLKEIVDGVPVVDKFEAQISRTLDVGRG